ncbi:MAG TPA: OsmC family protein [Gemmatimonadota bacterium]
MIQTPKPSAPPPMLTVDLTWSGDHRFESRGRAARGQVDGDGAAAPSPMETLLAALASCAAADIVDILRKGRQDLRALSVQLTGERSTEVPRRFTSFRARVRVVGAVERAKAERAAELAFEKYCSVRATLDPAIPLEIVVELEKEARP